MAIISYPDAPNRRDTLAEGEAYQAWVLPYLGSIGICPTYCTTREDQYAIGESYEGIEIKEDRRSQENRKWLWNGQEYIGRLSIEVAEKTTLDRPWVDSGIYRSDNTWLYIQGNRERIFVFARKTLQLLHERMNYLEHREPTVRAFYLPFSHAERYAATVICPDELNDQMPF